MGDNAAEQATVVPAVPGYWSYTPLSIPQARWYYLKTPLSLKGVYEQDILHRAHLQRFCTSDSTKLESAFVERREQLEKVWWEEHAELGARAVPSSRGGNPAELPEQEDSSVGWQDYFHGHTAEDEIGLLVRGGLYEADLKQRRLKACYWPEASHRVLRGTWFVEKSPDWVPLKEATADELEEAYRSEIWNPNKGQLNPQKVAPVQAARVDLHTLTNEAKGWFALFLNEDEIYLCKDDSFSWLSRKLNSSSAAPGMRLRRGYVAPPEGLAVQEADPKAEEADEIAAAQPVNKLLLVVHGIGQNLSGSNIAGDAAAVRQNLNALSADQLGEKERTSGRTEVLPVQWRKHLNLDVDSMAEVLMPPGVRSLRMMLHATAVEVLLYLTPLHCQDMLDSLVDSLNLQFSKFQRRNPGFCGEVSILAHSLGSVLCYDILCNQPHLFAAVVEKNRLEEAGGMLGCTSPTQNAPKEDSASDLKPLESRDLDPDETQDKVLPLISPQRESSTATRGGELGPSAIPSDLTDLSDLMPHSKSLPSNHSELQTLRKENARLQHELHVLRRNSSLSSLTSSPSLSAFRSAAAAQERTSLAPPVSVKPLVFAVDRFIAAGSPLGIFLTLRRVNPSKGRGLGTPEAAELMVGAASRNGDGLPAVQRMYNLYHPFDPVGFRLEPLIMAGAENRRPVYAAYCKGGRKLHVGFTEFSEDVSAAMSAGAARASSLFQQSLSSLKLTALTTTKKSEAKEPSAVEGKLTAEEEAAEEGVRQASQGTKSAVWRLTEGQGEPLSATFNSRSARGRLDFVLQSGNVENPWLSAMSSHFAYWTSPDVALFILRALHHQDVRLGPPKEPAKQAGVKHNTGTEPSSPVSALTGSGPSPVLSPTSAGAKSPALPRGLTDPEDWW